MAARASGGVHHRPGKLPPGCLDELIAFAEHQFALARRRSDGATEREHLLSVERQTGRRAAALDGPDLPEDGAHVWAWFLHLSAGRGSNGFGANPLSWLDLLAWTWLTGIILRPAEVDAIFALDHRWLELSPQDETRLPTSGDRKLRNAKPMLS